MAGQKASAATKEVSRLLKEKWKNNPHPIKDRGFLLLTRRDRQSLSWVHHEYPLA
jgi:hypothetical protein